MNSSPGVVKRNRINYIFTSKNARPIEYDEIYIFIIVCLLSYIVFSTLDLSST